MILTGEMIKREVKIGKIQITPFNEDQLNPNSYNYRLGTRLLEITDVDVDPYKAAKYREIHLTGKGFILDPKKYYLGCTVEEIGGDFYVTKLIGRSSVGRLGLFLQITAPLGHLGAKHCWTLELKCVQPLKVYPHMKIGQVSFWKVCGKKHHYNGKYHQHNEAHISKFHCELETELK
jgi:dCTP deaminase